MRRNLFAAAALFAVLAAAPQVADAGSGYVTGNVVLRAGPGAGYGKIITIPAHARVGVYRCATYCEVVWGTYRGYASAGFVTVGKERFARSLAITPVGPGVYVPIYPKGQVAYISSAFRPEGVRGTARAFYFDGRFLDRPDYFLAVVRP